TPSVGSSNEQFVVRSRDVQGDDADLGIEVNEQADRLTKAAAARQFVAGQSIDPAIIGEQRQPVRGLRMEMDRRAVAFAPFELGDFLESDMALHRPDPAAL